MKASQALIEAEAPAAADNGLRPTSTNLNYGTAPEQFERVIANLDEPKQEILRWWFFLGKDNGWGLSRLAKEAGTSSTTLSRVFSGNYGAELDKICDTLTKARKQIEKAVDNPEFIHTSLVTQIWEICDQVRTQRTVGIIQGMMGIGKTKALAEYKRRNNHGKTIYYRCEPGMTLVQFINSIAEACGVGKKSRTQIRVRNKLYQLLAAGQRLLIIDELHQLFLRRNEKDITPILQCEFLRCIFDKADELSNGKGCGMILCGTDTLNEYLTNAGPSLAQLRDRGTTDLELPGLPTEADARTICNHYQLPPLTSKDAEAGIIIQEILQSTGIRQIILHVRAGASLAAELKQRYEWSHFVKAFRKSRTLGKRSK